MEKLKSSLSQIQFQGTPGNHLCTLDAIVLVLSEFCLICCSLEHTWLCKKFYDIGLVWPQNPLPAPTLQSQKAQQPAGVILWVSCHLVQVDNLRRVPAGDFLPLKTRPLGGTPCCHIFLVAPWECLFFHLHLDPANENRMWHVVYVTPYKNA